MKQHGFTIIELVIATVLVGVLVAIATLNFRAMTSKANLESQIKQMYSDLMTARIEAMDRTTSHFVTLNAQQYAVYEDTLGACSTSNCPIAGEDLLLNPPPMTNTILWNSGTPSGVEIIFDSRGLVQVTTGTISINDTIGAAYDCILVETTKTSMGAMNAMNGGSCVPK